MKTIDRDEMRKRVGRDDVVVVEALSPDSYSDFHIPTAVNIPAGADDFEERAEAVIPDKSTEVVVYCADASCDASAKAGQRLEKIGYSNVVDYEAGKKDWKEAGLPIARG